MAFDISQLCVCGVIYNTSYTLQMAFKIKSCTSRSKGKEKSIKTWAVYAMRNWN